VNERGAHHDRPRGHCRNRDTRPAHQGLAGADGSEQIQKYMFGSRVETNWKAGSRMTWKGKTEEAAEHSRANWEKMLSALKEVVERQS
jgi:hypothetical protein